MKTLIFVRHGKSSWKHAVGDKKRPLKKRGITDANLIANCFKSTSLRLDFVITSPAKRAHDTCKIFLKNLEISYQKVLISPVIYDFSGVKTLKFIKLLPDEYKNVMLFGHNHAFTALVNLLGSIKIDNVPTSGLVIIEFNVDTWVNIENGITTQVTFPKQLR